MIITPQPIIMLFQPVLLEGTFTLLGRQVPLAADCQSDLYKHLGDRAFYRSWMGPCAADGTVIPGSVAYGKTFVVNIRPGSIQVRVWAYSDQLDQGGFYRPRVNFFDGTLALPAGFDCSGPHTVVNSYLAGTEYPSPSPQKAAFGGHAIVIANKC